MKTIPIRFTLACLTGGAALAQPAPADAPAGHRPPPPPPLIALFDADRDGRLSAAEVAGAAAALGALDRNADGEVTMEEARPSRQPEGAGFPGPPPHGGMSPPPPILAALDADQDGFISAEEMKHAPEALGQLDRNGDGELSPEEQHPFGPPPPPPGEGEGRRPPGPPPEGHGEQPE